MTPATLTRLVAAMLVLTVISSVIMLQFDWNGPAASEQAGPIDTLLDVMIILSCFVFAVVMVMLVYAIWRYRAKPGDESDGEPIHGNTRLEIIWTAIPTVIVLGAAIYSWIVLEDIEAREPDRMRVNVIAQQFAWRFDYVDEGVTSANLHVPVGRQVELEMTALDVIHSFWVPEWRIKRDLVPAGEGGDEIDRTVVVTPDREGTYSVVCTELCGIGHATMRAFAVVQPQEDFDAWVSEQQPIPEDNPGTGAAAGGNPAAPADSIEGS